MKKLSKSRFTWHFELFTDYPLADLDFKISFITEKIIPFCTNILKILSNCTFLRRQNVFEEVPLFAILTRNISQTFSLDKSQYVRTIPELPTFQK